MKKILLPLLCAISLLHAQQDIKKCHTNEYLHYLEYSQPELKERVKQMFDLAQEHAENHRSHKVNRPDTIYHIPVVFHVVYDGQGQNVDQALLESQIDVLNVDFRRMNADTTNTRAVFQDRAGDVGFEFFFATIDPEGNPTNGITRTATSSTFNILDLDAMKSDATGGKDAWNTAEYLNIWVCEIAGLFGEVILGFANPPAVAPNWPASQLPSDPNLDGVVIHYEVIGKNNPLAVGQLSIADQGRTAVHEVGHYWGLRHVWGDSGDPLSGNPDCAIAEDDGFDDTPHMGNNSRQTGCSFNKNTCTNGESPDEPDMVENYMDYSTELCQNMFTQQQADLMRSMAVLGRPDLVHILQNEEFNLNPGDWIVVNGTDTFLMDPLNPIDLQAGDEVMFLNENNGFTYTVVNPSIIITGAADAQVGVDSSAFFTQRAIETSIKELQHSSVSLFPNPAQDFFAIEHEFDLTGLHLNIYNRIGQQVKSLPLNKQNQRISTSDLSHGFYFVEIRNHSSLLSVSKLQLLK